MAASEPSTARTLVALRPSPARQIQRPPDLSASVLKYSAKRVIRPSSRSICRCKVSLRAVCCSTRRRKASTCSERPRCSISYCADNLFKAAVNFRSNSVVARGRAPRPAHGLARGVLRRAGCAPAHAVLTSTHRTARCGPACLVVWEGKDRDRRSSPIPIVSKVLRRPPDLRLGGCACPTRRSAGRPGQMLLDDLTPIGNPAGFGWKTMRLVSSQGACLPLREDLICPCHVSNGERTVCTVP